MFVIVGRNMNTVLSDKKIELEIKGERQNMAFKIGS